MSDIIQNETIKSLFLVVRKYEDALRQYVTTILNENFATPQELLDSIENEKKIIQNDVSDNIARDRQVKLESLNELTRKSKIIQIYNGVYNNIRFYDIILVIQVFISLFEPYSKSITRDLHQLFYYLNQTKEIRNSFSHEQLEEVWNDLVSDPNKIVDFSRYKISLPTLAIINFILQSFKFLENNTIKDLNLNLYKQECNKIIQFLTNSVKINNLYEVEDQFKSQFIKRENELSNHLIRYILDGHRSSYAVLGMGGVGKSRLAFEFAQKALISNKYDFIFWISSKEEEVRFDSNSGYRISKIKANFSSIGEFIKEFCDFRGIYRYDNIDNLYQGYFQKSEDKGIIIIDNFDNLELNTRHSLLTLIENIQSDQVLRNKYKFIVTSREDKAPNEIEGYIKLSGFLDEEGHSFIEEYCKSNNINNSLKKEQVDLLIKESIGVTLILVMAIEAVNNKTMDFERIISILQDSSSTAIKELGEYFFREAIDFLVRSDENVKNILLTLHYFEGAEIIDISRITKISLKDLELKYLPDLTARYAVRLSENGYVLNDFAAHYVYYRFILGYEQEVGILHKGIVEYMNEMDTLLRDYEETKDSVKSIIQEWKPRNKAEQIANYKAYFYFRDIIGLIGKREAVEKIESAIETKFNEIYSIQTTPYVYFQHARVVTELIKSKYKINSPRKKELIHRTIRLYENCRSMSLSNRELLKEKSYPSMLFHYGIFIKFIVNDNEAALNLFWEASNLLRANNLSNEFVFFQICFNAINTICQIHKNGGVISRHLENLQIYKKIFDQNKSEVRSNKRLLLEIDTAFEVNYQFLQYSQGKNQEKKSLTQSYMAYNKLEFPRSRYYLDRKIEKHIQLLINKSS